MAGIDDRDIFWHVYRAEAVRERHPEEPEILATGDGEHSDQEVCQNLLGLLFCVKGIVTLLPLSRLEIWKDLISWRRAGEIWMNELTAELRNSQDVAVVDLGDPLRCIHSYQPLFPTSSKSTMRIVRIDSFLCFNWIIMLYKRTANWLMNLLVYSSISYTQCAN